MRNWFWDCKEPGLTPLLLGMGAATCAFLPVRNAVFAEGASDFILLPALLRDAAGEPFLGFQVAPGLAEIAEIQVPLIARHAPKVAFVVDADKGGREIAAKLRRAEIMPERIFSLPGPDQTVLEDYVDSGLYLQAANEYVTARLGADVQIAPEEVSGPNRSRQLDLWCRAHNVESPSRRHMAYRVIELGADGALTERDRKGELVGLLMRLRDSLDVSTTPAE